jgi:hypothetical protein
MTFFREIFREIKYSMMPNEHLQANNLFAKTAVKKKYCNAPFYVVCMRSEHLAYQNKKSWLQIYVFIFLEFFTLSLPIS